ncbi:hypothetical protein QBC40DRAFT_260816 [Triangularia verruculosa]|uniref:Clr5 domain-containing protein n=1 Tax=Triangularia verruculosa TaxID=2587418 RepID=A0AAN6XU36_9PEZI|nr:hypothetical protein QBC40DRAFT_260816 [Triangularia verruculosa]
MEGSIPSLDAVPMDTDYDLSRSSAETRLGTSPTPIHISTNVTSKTAPSRIRKAKAAIIRDEVWERHKAHIIELHIRQKKTLPQVADIFQRDFQFEATIRQWRSRITKWGLDKKVKTKEMVSIVQLRQQRMVEEPEKRRRKYEVRGTQVSERQIDGFIKSNGAIPSITAAGITDIPPDVKYWTASSSGSGSSASEHSEGSASPTSITMALSPALSTITLQLSGYGDPIFQGRSPGRLSISSVDPIPGGISAHFEATETPMDITAVERAGDSYHSQGRYRKALEAYRELAKQARQQYGVHSEQFITSLIRLGDTLLNQGRASEARKLLERSYSLSLSLVGGEEHSLHEAKGHHSRGWEISQRVHGPTHLETLLHHVGLADCYRGIGQLSEAIPLYKQLLELTDHRLHFPTVQAWTGLAVAYGLQHDFGSAISYAKKAVERVEESKGGEHPNTRSRQDDLTALYVRANLLGDAEAMCRRTCEKKARILGVSHPETLLNELIMVSILLGQGRVDEAWTLCERVLEQLGRILGGEHPKTVAGKLLMVDILTAKGENGKAMALLEECNALKHSIPSG